LSEMTQSWLSYMSEHAERLGYQMSLLSNAVVQIKFPHGMHKIGFKLLPDSEEENDTD